ncbi:hypothetical protein [Akkermansia sp.]|uniref:hypothetical protein n=1 Tax=Akkermansia sp. TaxID=1872421 RepID=UPI0025C3731C|nr:hypothetical protein [Akkermansia sp.]MCD8272383.1 helix-turn-helix domain-containing protein [Akkermansia sp.]
MKKGLLGFLICENVCRMEDFKQTVKDWLRSKGRKVDWLADQLGVSRQTVYSWLSVARQIPKGHKNFIEKLIREDSEKEVLQNISTRVVLEFTPEQYAVVKAEANRRGLTVEEWAREVLQSLANVTVRVRA